MDTQSQENVQNQKPSDEEIKNLKILTHHKYFTASLVEMLNILQNKSDEVDLESLDVSVKSNVKIQKTHSKLRVTCAEIKSGLLNESDYDQGKIIKKIYKVITSNMDLFYPVPSASLFKLKNSEGAIITIIPGLDVNVVTSMMNDSELDSLWNYMYMMYISAFSLISLTNENKKSNIAELLPKMRERVVSSGILKDNNNFINPYFGISAEDSNKYDIESMFENVDEIQAPTGDIMANMLKMSGIEKMVDLDKINDSLKNIKDEDKAEATKSIAKLLGAEGDNDIEEVCNTLVEGIIGDLKNNKNGLNGVYETAKSVAQSHGSKIDSSKMEKTVEKLQSFMQNGEKNLENMTDENGNPIGSSLLNSLKGPMNMANMAGMAGMPGMGGGGLGNMKNMGALFSQISKLASEQENPKPKSTSSAKSSVKSSAKSNDAENAFDDASEKPSKNKYPDSKKK
jgi:hypothetical protein